MIRDKFGLVLMMNCGTLNGVPGVRGHKKRGVDVAGGRVTSRGTGMKKRASCTPLFMMALILPGIVWGQLASLQHEPDLKWRTLVTPHFWVHYPAGFEELGTRVAAISEELYGPISSSLNSFPARTHVVVHTRVDFPSGVVSFLPWRMELFVTEPQGNVAGSGDPWLRVVIAHELTHIVHLRKRRGLSTLTGPFLGEFNVFWQNIVPLWFTEGFATLNETRYTSGGAARVPYVWMQMAAPVHAGTPWRLESTSHVSRKRMPRQRMPYVSGYYLTERLEREFGPGTWSRILDRYAAFPLLGFPRAVKSVTGTPLATLYRRVLGELAPSEPELSPGPPARLWRPADQPENQYSPRWVDGDHLMVYRKSFDQLDELALIDRQGGAKTVLVRSLAKAENGFTVGKRVIVWGELQPHPRFSATIYSDLKTYDLNTATTGSLTRNARLYSADLAPDESKVVAVQTDLPTARLVTVEMETGTLRTALEIPGATLLNPRWSPDGNRLVFTLRDSSGYQNIALLDIATGQWRYLYPPDTYHDNNPCWTPDGRFVMYTSDRSGIFNIWAVRVRTGKRWQVTFDPLGAFTPDVSPDGGELAFASYSHLGFRAATMALDSTQWVEDERVTRVNMPGVAGPAEASLPYKTGESWSPRPYRPWRHVFLPQGWFPYPFWDRGDLWLALFAASGDPLHRHSWRGNWGRSAPGSRHFADFLYRYSGWWAVATLRLYSFPNRVSANGQRGWWQKDGGEVTASVPLVTERNVYITVIRPFVRWRYYRWRPISGSLVPSRRLYRGVQLGFTRTRVARTPRDVVPHRAAIIAAFADWTGPGLGSDFTGTQISASGQLFLPTLIPHHQLEATVMYQHRTGNVSWSSSGALPLGHTDDGNTHNIRLKLAYHFPLAYLEWPVPVLPLWMDYLDGALFFDWGSGWDNNGDNGRPTARNRFSAGVRIAASQFFLERFPVRLGANFFYHSKDRAWRWSPVVEFPF